MFQNILAFLKETRVELKKVNWPTRQETIRFTLIVIAISAALSLFLGTLDFVFNFLMNRFVI